MRNKQFFSLGYILLPLLVSNFLLAQDRTLLFQGNVLDSLSKEALVFVNIRIVGSTLGTSTNLDGRFQLLVKSGDQIRFSNVGYEDKTIVISAETFRNEVIELSQKKMLLNEFVVTPGMNPAWRIIRHALINRRYNNPDEYSSYQYTSYNKTIIHMNTTEESNYGKRNQKQDSLKKAQRYKRNSILSNLLQEQMYLWLKETQVSVAHKRPNQTKELILAHKSSMPNDFSLGFIPTDFQPLGFYSEIIKLDALGQTYVNPLSNNCLNRYNFKLENTLFKGVDTIFIVSFVPKSQKNFNGFKGLFYINSEGYALENVIAETVDTLSKFQMRIQQQSRKIGQHWFPEILDTEMSLNMGKDETRKIQINIHNRSYIEGVEINQTIPENIFSYAKREEKITPLVLPDSNWQLYRIEPLNQRESNTYLYWDTVNALKPIRNFLKIYNGLTRILATDRWPIGKVFSLRVSDFAKFNKYEGTRWGLGGQVQFPGMSWFNLGGYTGYGIKDQAWKYGVTSEIKLHQHADLKLKVSLFKDLAEPGVPSMLSNTYNLLAAFNQPRSFLQFRFDEVRTKRLDVYWRPAQGWQINPFFLDEERDIISYEYFYGIDKKMSSFNLREVGFNLRLAPFEKLYKSDNLESILAQTFPVLDLQMTKGNFGTNDSWFSTLQFNFDHQIISKSLGRSTYRFSAGKIWGSVPYPYLFNIPGSNLDQDFQILVPRTFQVAGFYEFAGDQFAALFWEHNFGELLFKSKSPFFKPSLSLVQHVGFSHASKREVHHNLTFDTMKKGYYESGLYLRDILRVPYYDMFYLNFGIGGMMRWGPYRRMESKENFAFQFMIGIGF